MTIDEMILAGMPEDEIARAIAEARAAKAAADEKAARAQNKETLLEEARAHAVNAILAYIDAFDLVEEPIGQEDVDELLELVTQVEKLIPVYKKMYDMMGAEEEGADGIIKIFRGLM